jgi:aminoglycoside/choline kinase family phosphotransferase
MSCTPDHRLSTLRDWLQMTLAKEQWSLLPLTGDASFRRYFRVQLATRSLIAVDAPPRSENNPAFIAIAQAFAKLGIAVPHIFAANIAQGFLLLSDLGDNLYLPLLAENNVAHLYYHALEVLQRVQLCRAAPGWSLPTFDQALLLREWNLFQQWTVEKHWQVTPDHQQQHLLSDTFAFLAREISAQPRICVHRDYHSRNLLWLESQQAVGILDFQDAVWGPITYDALSLLRDCYISWPQHHVTQWMLNYFERTRENGLLKNISADQFTRWFDLAGIQRHLKALGIFTRLNYLYGKPGYIKDIPRTLNYILQVSANYAELKNFRAFLQRYAG